MTQTQQVDELIDERKRVYGEPAVTFPQIAAIWSAYLGTEVEPTDVPIMMMQMKMVRARQAPDYSDNTDDIEGYLDIYRTLVDTGFPQGMIHARTVDEYVNKKYPRSKEAGIAQAIHVPVYDELCQARGSHSPLARHTPDQCVIHVELDS